MPTCMGKLVSFSASTRKYQGSPTLQWQGVEDSCSHKATHILRWIRNGNWSSFVSSNYPKHRRSVSSLCAWKGQVDNDPRYNNSSLRTVRSCTGSRVIWIHKWRTPTETGLYYSDSKVVLSYISNDSRRFYVYVSNRVERIRRTSAPHQWNYVVTHLNLADLATRSVEAGDWKESMWYRGPKFLFNSDLLTSTHNGESTT